MESLADPLLEEYLRVCYGYSQFQQPSREALSPEEEEFAECDACLARNQYDEEDRATLEKKLCGLVPLNSTTVGGLSMQTFVRSRGNSEPVFSTEVRVAHGYQACGLWKPGSRWPDKMKFSIDSGVERQAGTLWPSSLKLASVLLRDEEVAAPLLREGAKIIELGAGVGFLVTIVALMGCQHVVATDHPCCQQNAFDHVVSIAPSVSHVVSSIALDWTEPLPDKVAEHCPWDVVLCSDLLPYTSMHVGLCDKLVKLSRSRNGGAAEKAGVVLMAYEVRQPKQEEGFFKLVREHFDVEAVTSPAFADLDAHDWHLLRLHPR